MDEFYIGLDAHKENIVATVLDGNGTRLDQAEFPARAPEIQAYLARWRGRRHVVLEACNVWEHVYDAAAAAPYLPALPATDAASPAPLADVAGPDASPIDFLRLKNEFRRLFPPGHPIRRLVEAEADLLPRREGLAKLEMVVRLVWALRRPRA